MVVDDEQGHAGQLGELRLAGVGERRLGEFFEEGVRIARPTPPVRVSP